MGRGLHLTLRATNLKWRFQRLLNTKKSTRNSFFIKKNCFWSGFNMRETFLRHKWLICQFNNNCNKSQFYKNDPKDSALPVRRRKEGGSPPPFLWNWSGLFAIDVTTRIFPCRGEGKCILRNPSYFIERKRELLN